VWLCGSIRSFVLRVVLCGVDMPVTLVKEQASFNLVIDLGAQTACFKA
jgi:hypothetical protein